MLVAPAGATFYASITKVRAMHGHKAGKLEFSSAEFDRGNGQRVRLRATDPSYDGYAATVILYVAILGPVVVALLPIEVPYWVYYAAHHPTPGAGGRTPGAGGHTPKAPPAEVQMEAGREYTFYADARKLVLPAAHP